MIPDKKELLEFIGRHELVNYSLIAKFFDINNATVTDLIKALEKHKLVRVKKLGGSKIVMLVKKGGKDA